MYYSLEKVLKSVGVDFMKTKALSEGIRMVHCFRTHTHTPLPARPMIAASSSLITTTC